MLARCVFIGFLKHQGKEVRKIARFKYYENPSNGHREKVKDGFNWLVLFLGPIWYFFNGMVGQGMGWFLVALLAATFTLGIGGIIVWIIAGFKANKDKEKKFLQQGWKFVGYDTDIVGQQNSTTINIQKNDN